MLHGQTLHSPLPQDIPWWMPDHAIFFGVLYLVLLFIMGGLGCVIFKSLRDAAHDDPHGQSTHH